MFLRLAILDMKPIPDDIKQFMYHVLFVAKGPGLILINLCVLVVRISML